MHIDGARENLSNAEELRVGENAENTKTTDFSPTIIKRENDSVHSVKRFTLCPKIIHWHKANLPHCPFTMYQLSSISPKMWWICGKTNGRLRIYQGSVFRVCVGHVISSKCRILPLLSFFVCHFSWFASRWIRDYCGKSQRSWWV